MALSKITYEDKETLNPLPSVADKNKVTDGNMNEIKSVVNSAIDQVEANTIPQQATAPDSPRENDLWIDTDETGLTEVDSVVSTTSTNPIENQAITNYVNSMNEYSTTEKVVGKWIDGKSIYRKCFSQNDLSNISTGITNIDTMVKMECLIEQTSTNDWRNLPWLFTGGQAGWQGGFFYKASDQTISFQVGSDLGAVQKTVVIMEYTKTS